MTATVADAGMSTEPVDGKCNARRTNGSGELCLNEAGKGTDHLGYGRCVWHGGKTVSHRKNGQMQRAMGEAGQLLAECADQVAGRGTVEALEDLRTHAAAMVMTLRILIDDLPVKAGWRFDQAKGAGGATQRLVTVEAEGVVGPDHQGNQRANVLVTLYGEWVDRSARVEKVAADLGLEERRVRVEEDTARMVVAVVRSTLVALGVSFDDALVPMLVAENLRAVEATARPS